MLRWFWRRFAALGMLKSRVGGAFGLFSWSVSLDATIGGGRSSMDLRCFGTTEVLPFSWNWRCALMGTHGSRNQERGWGAQEVVTCRSPLWSLELLRLLLIFFSPSLRWGARWGLCHWKAVDQRLVAMVLDVNSFCKLFRSSWPGVDESWDD
jgi:hypothetical protein